MIRRPRPTGPFLVRSLRASDREIMRALGRVLGHADEEAVHDLRVGIRRMRVLLKLARPLFGRHYADAVREGYTLVHRATGDLRDAEVLRDTLAQLSPTDPAFLAWLAMRRRREDSMRRAVVRGLEVGDLGQASARLHALLLLPIDPKRDRALAKFSRQSVQLAHARVLGRSNAKPEDGVALHALRIAYKGLRYAAEILTTALPPHLAAAAEPAAKFQKRLGEIHDLDVAVLVLGRARGLPPEVRADAIARLQARRAVVVQKFLAEPAIVLKRPPEPAPEDAPKLTPQR